MKRLSEPSSGFWCAVAVLAWILMWWGIVLIS